MPETTTTPNPETEIALDRIAEAIGRHQRFVITSHAQPDGDSVGSSVALGLALRRLGKDVRIVHRDPPPEHYLVFPGVRDIEVAERAPAGQEVAIVLECGDLSRTKVAGLERLFVINIDHHVGNTGFGALNWFDPSAAACGEMVFDVIERLGVGLTLDIATAVYLTILTDTGSFHHSNITPRTFEISRRVTEAGVNPAAMARLVFDSNSYGKLKLIGALLNSMELADDGRLAVMYLDDAMLQAAGCTYNDTEGLINLPLTARDIRAVVFFKVLNGTEVRVSLRSKDAIDVRLVAQSFGGGGHKNAAGFTVQRAYADVKPEILERVIGEIHESFES